MKQVCWSGLFERAGKRKNFELKLRTEDEEFANGVVEDYISNKQKDGWVLIRVWYYSIRELGYGWA